MQILQGTRELAGARGWLWRVERVERAGRQTTLTSLTRAADTGSRALTAVSPSEPMSRVIAPGRRPVPYEAAVTAVRRAVGLERGVFTVGSAERLAGDVHAWQLAAAAAFARGHARVLLADPVGMGKTVSAALAAADCLHDAPDRRCLVIAPGHLLAQWRAELRQRVAIDADVADAAGLRRLEAGLPPGMPAWARPGCLIASVDFIKQPHVVRSLESLTWDLLIIDEAHLACGESERHAACEMIARRARRLLLVTATPSDGGDRRLAALTGLGGAGERLVVLRHDAPSRRAVRERAVTLRPALSVVALHRALASYAGWISAAPGGGETAVALLASLLVKRALSSPHAAHLSLARRAALLDSGQRLAYQPSLLGLEDDPAVLGARSGRPRDEEARRLDTLVAMAARAARRDRRLFALERLVRRAREPVVIFSCFRDTALLIAGRLSRLVDTRIVHGALPPAVTSAALAAFTRGPARVLVATDVAADGLNLHARCRWVIHYDLPWRPSTLRQRNGRVDRLGQARPPHATMLVDRTALSRTFISRTAALAVRMRADDAVTPLRWRAIAAAEAARADARRERGAARAAAPIPSWPITVVEITLTGAGGVVLERCAYGVAAREDTAADWASGTAARRAAAIRRGLLARAARRIARERAVHAAALEPLSSTRVQSGLFDHRAERDDAARDGRRTALGRERRDLISRHLGERRVRAARIEIVAVFRKDPAR